MSYILEALRKSEQERQIAAGRGAGLLFLASPEQRPGTSGKIIWLAAAALLVIIGLNWWAWSRPQAPARAAPLGNTALPAPAIPAPPLAPPALPPHRQAGESPAAPASSRLPEIKTDAPSRPPVPTAKKQTRQASAALAPAPPTAPAARNVAPSEAQTGVPPINISGYLKDQTGDNLAIINDKLVREGDEVSPGLRLEKIDGENAVFTYKGQRFRR